MNELTMTSVQPRTDLPPGPLTSAELAAAVPDRRDHDRYERIWHGIYRRDDQPDDLLLRSRALARIWPEGVLRGRSAALVWGDDSVPDDALPEIWLPSTRRSREGRVYRYGNLPPVAVTRVDGLRLTTPLRTCRDLACDLSLEDAVVSVERLCAAVPGLAAQLGPAAAHPAGRGARRFAAVVGEVDPRSGSTASTRARLALRGAGLRGFAEGHEIRIDRRPVALPLADPVARCVVIPPGWTPAPGESGGAARYRTLVRRAGWTVVVLRETPGPVGEVGPPDEDRPVGGGGSSFVAGVLAVLGPRWPGSVALPPLIGEPAADPHGMWAGRLA